MRRPIQVGRQRLVVTWLKPFVSLLLAYSAFRKSRPRVTRQLMATWHRAETSVQYARITSRYRIWVLLAPRRLRIIVNKIGNFGTNCRPRPAIRHLCVRSLLSLRDRRLFAGNDVSLRLRI